MFNVVCIDCNFSEPYNPQALDGNCPACGSEWREAKYDYAAAARTWLTELERRPFDLWRYRELLPVLDVNTHFSMGEGGTPLYRAPNLGMMLGCPNIFIKDERQGPTSSFKDRQAVVGVHCLRDAGITEAVLASTGNVAIAYSAYAVRAGIKLWAFLTSLVPAEKMREVAIYGTQVIKVTGSYDQAKQVAAEFARQRGLYREKGARSLPSIEAMKTIAFEIAEQLTAQLGPPQNGARWRTPDWYFQSVSGGLGPLGVQKGFRELQKMGFTTRTPALACIQTEGCAPMAHAFRQGSDRAEPIPSPRTHIATLSTGDPGRTYTLLYQRMQAAAGGIFEDIGDEETFRTIHLLAKLEGLSVEPASAVAFAGLIKMARSGKIKPDDVIVVNCTGHTMPVEKMILGEGWARSLVLPSQEATGGRAQSGEASDVQTDIPEEGLLAALNRVTADRYQRVAIVDDTPDARRLIRRILQSQGNYTLFEAEDGKQALKVIRKELPDLVILDLMMPETDGFAVLDALKADPRTAAIPVIVVTAKELTPQEKQHLQGQIHSLMQKGEFLSDDLLEEVRALLD